MNDLLQSVANMAFELGYYLVLDHDGSNKYYILANRRTRQHITYKSLEGVICFLEVKKEHIGQKVI